MKPLAYLDLETTGINPGTDAIVSFALLTPGGGHYFVFKPWKPIPQEVEAKIGIMNRDVADKEPFKAQAVFLHELVKQYDLAGFNLRNFDVPLLWEEFYRCDIEWDLSETLIIDAGTIFKLKEARTLSAALQFYCGQSHDNAHNSMDDCLATKQVLEAQLQRYPDLGKMDRKTLAAASEYEGPKRLSLDGKIMLKDGDAIFGFGKHKDKLVRDNIDYAYWMLGADFSAHTKMTLRRLLKQFERGTETVNQLPLVGEPDVPF